MVRIPAYEVPESIADGTLGYGYSALFVPNNGAPGE